MKATLDTEKLHTMKEAGTENSAENSAKLCHGTGNPDKTKPFRFKPGQSGNPGGRPKKTLLDKTLEELLLAGDSAAAFAIAKAIITKAKRGDVKAAQLIAERTEGKPAQSIKVDGDVSVSSRRDRLREIIDKLAENSDGKHKTKAMMN